MTKTPAIVHVRNNMDDIVIKKVHHGNEDFTTNFYEYDHTRRIVRILAEKSNGTVFEDEIYFYTYDKNGGIKTKGCYSKVNSSAPNYETKYDENNFSIVYEYDYNDSGSTVKKTSKLRHTGEILYITEYIYNRNQLIEIRKFDALGELKTIEILKTVGSNILKTSMFPNGIISHSVMYFMQNNRVVGARTLNPLYGNERWKIVDYSDDSISVDIDEDVLLPQTLEYLLNHVNNIRSKKQTLVTICEFNTDRFFYAENCDVISTSEKKYGFSIGFYV